LPDKKKKATKKKKKNQLKTKEVRGVELAEDQTAKSGNPPKWQKSRRVCELRLKMCSSGGN